MVRLSTKFIGKLVGCIFFANQSLSVYAYKFDNGFLYNTNSNIDLNLLSNTDIVPVGDYYLDVYLNNKFITQSKVSILSNQLDSKIQDYCIPLKTVKILDFKKDFIDLSQRSTECINSNEMNHVVFWVIDIERQRLDVSSP